MLPKLAPLAEDLKHHGQVGIPGEGDSRPALLLVPGFLDQLGHKAGRLAGKS